MTNNNKKAPYKRGDVVQYKAGNGVALVVGIMHNSKVAKINWIVVPAAGDVYKEWFFQSRHPEYDFRVNTDSLGEVLCHVPMPEAGDEAS